MAPKTKKKKKTKEELEEERRQAEEAARLAEEERLRLEEEERQRLAELERQRQELLAQLTAQEDERIQGEMSELEPLFGQQRLERSAATEQRRQVWEWERFLSCTYVPHPRDRVGVDGFIRSMHEAPDSQLPETFVACQDCYSMVDEAHLFRLGAQLQGDQDKEGIHAKDVHALLEVCGLRIDRATAHVLQHSDEHANEKGEVQLGLQQGSFQWALWVNTSKNPRLKAVEMSALHMVVEIPKQVALANIALRIVITEKDEFFTRSRNEYMAVGGVMYVDLLALPPPAKHIRQWVLRQVTPLASNVARIPYPIPPAGADPSTFRSEEEPPPLGFAYPYRQDVCLLDGEQVKVGWWDPDVKAWSTEGVSDVILDPSSSSLSFHTTHLGPLAVIQSRARLLPYAFWSVRPTGGMNGKTAAVTLACPGLEEPVVIEVGPGYTSLRQPTNLPALAPLLGKQLPPEQLLLTLSAKGMHLLPEDRDAPVAGVVVKDRETEAAMCADLALLGGVCLIAKSKWNQAGAGPGECIARISEVTDWEAGGRTELRHLERVFQKEREDGERRVLAVMRRGTRGVAFCDALDRRDQYPALPGHENVESVQACMDTVWGEVHASLLSLLKGIVPKAANIAAAAAAAAAASASSGGAAAGGGGDASAGGAPPVPSGPSASGAPPPVAVESPLTARLCMTAEGLELVRNTDALFTETLGQLLTLLRVFSFSL